jgi:hypothetical protein
VWSANTPSSRPIEQRIVVELFIDPARCGRDWSLWFAIIPSASSIDSPSFLPTFLLDSESVLNPNVAVVPENWDSASRPIFWCYRVLFLMHFVLGDCASTADC